MIVLSTVVPAGTLPLFPTCRYRERSLTLLRYEGGDAANGAAEGTRTYPLGFVGAEQPRVVAFLDHDVGDPRPVVLLQADAGLPDGDQLRPRHLKHNDTHKKVTFFH